MRLLVVEDEKRMADLLRKGLQEEGYVVAIAANGPMAVEMAQASQFELILLDIMLPGMDGFQVAQRLRRGGNRVPILMLTARDATPDIVQGLDLGADDYVTKPFSFEVLLARIRALIRRGPASHSVKLRVGDLELDPGSHEVTRGGQVVNLTRTEFHLLEYLMRRHGQVIPRDVLIEAVWGYDRNIESNTLDAFIRLLRSKVEGDGGPRIIHTVRGIGYVAREQEPE
ncbi:MAG: response regulator transcription factor [Acidobacteria bacterium]|nr:response regulator transcription factor [Acidobacteriota bacterium]